MITEINKSKTLTEHVPCECKYKSDGRKCNSNQKWNNDKCCCECKKHHIFVYVKKIWNPARCSCNDGKFISKYYQ